MTDITVTHTDEKVTVGRHHWTGTIVLVGGERFAQGRTGTLYRECWKCRNFSGFLPEYAGIYAGECFGCRGAGYSASVETEAKAVSLAKRRITDQARRDRKRADQAAAKVSVRDAWAAAHPEVASALAEVLADRSDDGYAALDAWNEKWGGFVTSLAQQSTYKALTAAQAAAVLPAVTEAKAAAEAAADVASRQRYLDATEGAKVTVTGTVTVATSFERTAFNGYSTEYVALVIVEGTDAFEGVTFKMMGQAKALREAERGQVVELTGTVKRFAEYQGVPQTELIRPKMKVLSEATV
jgi:hypothetical protein